MADFAGTVATFLTLATTWYTNAAVRDTAKATLANHLRNFSSYQHHIRDAIEPLIILNNVVLQHPQVILQAIWVLDLDESLRQWLSEAGFRSAKKEVAVVIVRRVHGPSSSPVYAYRRRRRGQSGQLKLPTFGVSQKEGSFATLFEKLKEAFERLETMMSSDSYNNPDAQPITQAPAPYLRLPPNFGGRVGYDSDEERRFAGPETDFMMKPGPRYRSPPFMMSGSRSRRANPFHLTRRQQLRQDQALQDLSKRLEHGIADMLRTTGDLKGLEERRRKRRTLEDIHQRVLDEESREEEFAAEQRRQDQLERDRRRLDDLRSRRRMREHYPRMRVDLDAVDLDLGDPSRIFRDLSPMRRPRTEFRFPPPPLSRSPRRNPGTMPPPPPIFKTRHKATSLQADGSGVTIGPTEPRPANAEARLEPGGPDYTTIRRSREHTGSPSSSENNSESDSRRREHEMDELTRETAELRLEREMLASKLREYEAKMKQDRARTIQLEAERQQWQAERREAEEADERRRLRTEMRHTRDAGQPRDTLNQGNRDRMRSSRVGAGGRTNRRVIRRAAMQ